MSYSEACANVQPSIRDDYWEGEVVVTVTAEFAYYVDETWDVADATEARRQVEQELSTYLGEAFADQRFEEKWETFRVCDYAGCGTYTDDEAAAFCKEHDSDQV